MPWTSEPSAAVSSKSRGVGRRRSRRQQHLGTGDGQGERDGLGGGLPQPVPDLVVEGLGLARLGDVGVVAQPVEELRPVGLAVDGLQLVALDEGVALPCPRRRGARRGPSCPPRCRPGRERTEVRERVRIAVGFGVDVGPVQLHPATVPARGTPVEVRGRRRGLRDVDLDGVSIHVTQTSSTERDRTRRAPSGSIRLVRWRS